MRKRTEKRKRRLRIMRDRERETRRGTVHKVSDGKNEEERRLTRRMDENEEVRRMEK